MISSLMRHMVLTVASGLLLVSVVLSPTAAADDATGDALCTQPTKSCPQLIYQGLTYPYQREPASYLFIDGGVYPFVTATDDLLGDSTVSLPSGKVISVSDLLNAMGLSDHRRAKLVPLAGYGSNPAPSQLSRKFAKDVIGESVVIPVMKGWVDGFDVVWTPFFTGYGALPATIYPAPNVRADIWLTWMTESLVKRMDETEHLSDNWYARAELDDASFGFDGPQPEQLRVYVSCFGALEVDGRVQPVLGAPAEGRATPAIDSFAALSLVQPTVAPTSSVLEMVRDVVADPHKRAAYTKALEPFQQFTESGQFSKATCAGRD